MKKRHIKTLAYLSVVLTMFSAAPSLAEETRKATGSELKQEELERISNLLPSSNLYSEADQKTLFRLTHLDALNNPELRCDLLVPADWKLADVSASADLIKQDGVTQVPLAQIAPATGDDVATEIRYQRVPASVSPQEFLSLYAKAAGMTVIAQQQADFNGRVAHDALLKSTSVLTGQMLSRMTVFRRGAYLFMVVSTAQESEYPKWKRIFGAAASSFDPGAKVEKPGATAANQ